MSNNEEDIIKHRGHGTVCIGVRWGILDVKSLYRDQRVQVTGVGRGLTKIRISDKVICKPATL